VAHDAKSGRASHGRAKAWGIMWDFLSLPQRDGAREDRTPYELKRFGRGLRSINVWYSTMRTTTRILDLPMPTAENKARISRRGWCITERALSNITKVSSCCLTLTKENQALIMEALNWYVLADTCRASRTAPVSPGVFKQMLEEGMDREKAVAGSGIVFTNGKDATSICIPQYEEAFMRLFASEKALSYSELGWGEAAAEELAVAFQYLHARTGGIVSLSA